MLAKIKEGVTKEELLQYGSVKFDGYLKVIKKDRKDGTIKLENNTWYKPDLLELKKESGGVRYKGKIGLSVYKRKLKQEIVEDKKEETVEIDLGRVNMELKVGEYETKIRQLNKECESWMEDFNNAKQEKLEFEHKYNEVLNKNDSLNKRISLLQEQLRSKKNFWKTLFLINISIDIIYLLVRYLWM